MRLVAELVKKKSTAKPSNVQYEWPMQDTLMGIELEVEGQRRSLTTIYTHWTTHNDGSLLSGIEYVLAYPKRGNELYDAIQELMVPNNTFTNAPTSSTHIHMNMLDTDTGVLHALVGLVWLFESVFYEAGDISREWSGYSSKLTSAPSYVLALAMNDNISPEEFIRTFSRNSGRQGHSRYYGLNLSALVDYGSVEFRYFPTAETDEQMIRWVRLVQTFKKAAIALGNLQALENMMSSEERMEAFIRSEFAEFSELFLPLLSDFMMVRQQFLKMKLVMENNEDNTSLEAMRFDHHAISGAAFSKLVVPINMRNTSGNYSNFLLVGIEDNVPMPTGNEGRLMVYNQTLYISTSIGGYVQWQYVAAYLNNGPTVSHREVARTVARFLRNRPGALNVVQEQNLARILTDTYSLAVNVGNTTSQYAVSPYAPAVAGEDTDYLEYNDEEDDE